MKKNNSFQLETPRLAIRGAAVYTAAVTFVAAVLFVCRPGQAEVMRITEAGHFTPAGSVVSVAVKGNYAYIANGEDMRIISVANPALPSEAGVFETVNPVNDIALNGNYAYLANAAGGLRVVNVGNPASPVQEKTSSYYANQVAVYGGYAYQLYNFTLRVIDVSITTPTQAYSYTLPSTSIGLAVDLPNALLNSVFVAAEGSGLRRVNYTASWGYTETGYYDTPGCACGVTMAADNVYVADGAGGLQVIHVGSTGALTLAGSCDTPGNAWAVAVQGNYVYVADGTGSGLHVFNISNPASPYEVGAMQTPGNAQDVAVNGNYAFIADGAGGLRILDCATPFISAVSSAYALTGSTVTLAFQGGNLNRISGIRLQRSGQTVSGASLDMYGNTLSASFALTAAPGLYDLVWSADGVDYTAQSEFTLSAPWNEPTQWLMTDLGKAGNAAVPGPGGIAIADADSDGHAELYVAYNDRTLSCFKKDSAWTISYPLDVPGETFQQVVMADGNYDGNWELYASGAKAYESFINGSWQSNTICTYGGCLTAGDGNHDGAQEFYLASGNSCTGQGVAQIRCVGGRWEEGCVESVQSGYAYTALLAGDWNNDHADEVYAVNQDIATKQSHYLYQFKYNGTAWAKKLLTSLGEGRTCSLSMGDLDGDGMREVYAANEDGHVYQVKAADSGGASWTCASVGNTLCAQIAVGDGDNDGQVELYGAGRNGHAYQFKSNAGAWQALDLGNAGTPLQAVAVGDGDGDSNFRQEVYALGFNQRVYQFAAIPASQIPTATPTSTPTPQAGAFPSADSLKIFHSRINPLRGEQARITWIQTQAGAVSITIYNLLGDKIIQLADQRPYSAGEPHELTWDGRTQNGTSVGSGIYIVDLQAESFKSRSKIAVIK